MAYVYKHIRLDTNEVFYVGVAKKKYRCFDQKNRNSYWKNIVGKVGYSIEIVAENISYKDALDLEKDLIKTIGRKDLGLGPLVNMTHGGEGTLGSANPKDHLKGKTFEEIYGKEKAREIKEKMKGNRKPGYKRGPQHAQFGKKRPDISAKLIGRKHTQETRKKISDIHKGKKRKPLSEEHKQKIGEAGKGKKRTEESKRKMSERRKGRKLSEESRKKISEYRKGKPLSSKIKEKISKAGKGRKHTDESKKKMSNRRLGIPQQKLECPHCKLSGGITNMKRYHFENCNNKIEDIYLK